MPFATYQTSPFTEREPLNINRRNALCCYVKRYNIFVICWVNLKKEGLASNKC